MQNVLIFVASTLLAMAAGVSVVVQQAINANLRASLDSAVWAGFVSYAVGTLCMLTAIILLREAIPSAPMLARSNWWAWIGGAFGAIFIAISIFLVPRLGAATFIALLVAGQMIASLVIDNYGLFGVPQHSADLPRLAGAALLVGAVILMRL